MSRPVQPYPDPSPIKVRVTPGKWPQCFYAVTERLSAKKRSGGLCRAFKRPIPHGYRWHASILTPWRSGGRVRRPSQSQNRSSKANGLKG
jgi:hypothetical protein